MPQYFFHVKRGHCGAAPGEGVVDIHVDVDLRDIAFFEEEVVGFTDFEGERERTAQKVLVARTDRRHALGR